MRTILVSALQIIADVVAVLAIGAGIAVLASVVLWIFLTANGANPFQ